MGVSAASLSDVLRRGTKKVIKYYLENLLLDGKK
jgi:predicted DNA binding protein